MPAADGRDVVDLVRAGNLPATRALRQAGRDIGEVLASAVSLLNPSVDRRRRAHGRGAARRCSPACARSSTAARCRWPPATCASSPRQRGPQAGVLGAAMMVVESLLSVEQVDLRLAEHRA